MVLRKQPFYGSLILHFCLEANLMAHDVFISYSHKDKSVADGVVAALEQKNIRCWYAPRDIKPGMDWGEEIVKAVSKSRVFLLIFSKYSNSSQRVLDELNVAITNELVIIPFRIEKMDPSGAMLLHLSSRHWLDAFVPSWEKHIDDLVKSVSSNLEKTTSPAGSNLAKTSSHPFLPKKRTPWIFGIALAVIALVAFVVFGLPWLSNQSGNSPSSLAATHTVSPPSITPTVTEQTTPQDPELGTAANPIIWMYVPPIDLGFQDVNALVAGIVDQFSVENPGLQIKAIPAADKSSIIEALCDGNAHLGSLSTISYLIASQRECAESKLIWSSFGYGNINFAGMVITKDTSAISTISDLQGKSICIPTSSSFSGWILPSLEIQALFGDYNTYLGQIIDKGAHAAVLQAVYDRECDVGATFDGALEFLDLPGVNEHLKIVFTTLLSPGQNMSIGKTVKPELSGKLVEYFMKISSGSDDLARVLGQYDADAEYPARLIEINDYYYSEIRDLFQRAGADPKDYLYSGN